METVKFGIVGAGVMGAHHLATLRDMDGAELAAVCDVDRSKAEAMAQETGAAAFTEYESMVQRQHIDAVIIATPHYFHPDVAVHAFANNVHVLCEKPLAVHVNDVAVRRRISVPRLAVVCENAGPRAGWDNR